MFVSPLGMETRRRSKRKTIESECSWEWELSSLEWISPLCFNELPPGKRGSKASEDLFEHSWKSVDWSNFKVSPYKTPQVGQIVGEEGGTVADITWSKRAFKCVFGIVYGSWRKNTHIQLPLCVRYKKSVSLRLAHANVDHLFHGISNRSTDH